jgi:hypothetical protein
MAALTSRKNIDYCVVVHGKIDGAEYLAKTIENRRDGLFLEERRGSGRGDGVHPKSPHKERPVVTRELCCAAGTRTAARPGSLIHKGGASHRFIHGRPVWQPRRENRFVGVDFGGGRRGLELTMTQKVDIGILVNAESRDVGICLGQADLVVDGNVARAHVKAESQEPIEFIPWLGSVHPAILQ